jgi:hypothetical protein
MKERETGLDNEILELLAANNKSKDSESEFQLFTLC